MRYIILLFIFWLLLSYLFDNFIVAAIITEAFVILGIYIGLRNGYKHKKQSTRNTNNKYNGIEYHPINNTSIEQNTDSSSQYHITISTSIRESTDSSPSTNVSSTNYEVFHRNRDEFCDNMNYYLYQCKGKYVQTNRKRTIKIEAFDESSVKEQMKQAGFIEPFERMWLQSH